MQGSFYRYASDCHDQKSLEASNSQVMGARSGSKAFISTE